MDINIDLGKEEKDRKGYWNGSVIPAKYELQYRMMYAKKWKPFMLNKDVGRGGTEWLVEYQPVR